MVEHLVCVRLLIYDMRYVGVIQTLLGAVLNSKLNVESEKMTFQVQLHFPPTEGRAGADSMKGCRKLFEQNVNY